MTQPTCSSYYGSLRTSSSSSKDLSDNNDNQVQSPTAETAAPTNDNENTDDCCCRTQHGDGHQCDYYPLMGSSDNPAPILSVKISIVGALVSILLIVGFIIYSGNVNQFPKCRLMNQAPKKPTEIPLVMSDDRSVLLRIFGYVEFTSPRVGSRMAIFSALTPTQVSSQMDEHKGTVVTIDTQCSQLELHFHSIEMISYVSRAKISIYDGATVLQCNLISCYDKEVYFVHNIGKHYACDYTDLYYCVDETSAKSLAGIYIESIEIELNRPRYSSNDTFITPTNRCSQTDHSGCNTTQTITKNKM